MANASSSGPSRTWARAGGRALLLLSIVIVLLPTLLFAPHLADQMVRARNVCRHVSRRHPSSQPRSKSCRSFGRRLGAAWDRVIEVKGNLRALLEPYTANLEQLMIGAARGLADSLVQVLLSLIVAIMFWTNGDGLVSVLYDALRGLGGPVAEHELDVYRRRDTRRRLRRDRRRRDPGRPACDRPGRRRSPRGRDAWLGRFAARDQPDRRTAAHLIWGGAAWWLFTQGPADEIRGFVSLLRQADAHRRCPEWVKVRPMFH